ncbi:MAG: serine hydrolase, partial [Bacteroidota bacterium]
MHRITCLLFLLGTLALLSSLPACTSPSTHNSLIEQLLTQAPFPAIDSVMADPARFELQILYTQIDRAEDGTPSFHSHSFRLDTDRYFYPASTVKFPTALMALEKIKEMGIPASSPMLTDSLRPSQSSAHQDHSSESGQPSVSHYVRKIFLVSDNDAYNRLYEFVGQGPLNQGLWNKGYSDLRLSHRLSIFLPKEENRHTNPIRFLLPEGEVLHQPAQYNPNPLPTPPPILKGQGEIIDDSLVRQPKDFASKNAFPLATQQKMLRALFFPTSLPDSMGFDLRPEDRQAIQKAMGELPRESTYPAYDQEEFHDSYVKFFIFGDSKAPIPDYLRIYNKVGYAYG